MGYYDLLALCGVWTANADSAVTYVYPFSVTVTDAARHTATVTDAAVHTLTVSDA